MKSAPPGAVYRADRPRRALLADDGLQVGEDFFLELVEALTEGLAEVAVAVLSALERFGVCDHAGEALARDQVVGPQAGELGGRQRALPYGWHREAARGDERLA